MHLFMAFALLAVTAPRAIVLAPVGNMYKQANDASEVVSQAVYGSTIQVLEERPQWLHVRTADEYAGWMAISDVRKLAPGENPYASAGRVAHIESLEAHIYHEPDVTQRRPLVTVPYETRLEVTAEPKDKEGWLGVRLPDGRDGWLQRGDVSFDNRPLSMDATIALSRRFLGLPYTWGGTSSFGYDCSGYMQMLYRRHGVLMPRDADQQAAWSGLKAVTREELQAGDLLYFGKSVSKITHTGMYLGDGKFINATTWAHPVLQICDLGDPHWDKLLVACRRLK